VNAKNFIQLIYTTSESLVKQYQLGSYGIWGANVGYKFNDSFSLRVGVNNILDKRIYVIQVQHAPIMSVVVLTLLI
jgi:outer membrane receptor fepA